MNYTYKVEKCKLIKTIRRLASIKGDRMKVIGLIGGMSWESTSMYYQIINRTIKENLGGLHSAKCILYSVDFAEIEACQSSGDWKKCAEILSGAARSLERAGADCIVICTNTMHKIAKQVEMAVKIPLLHIATLTAKVLLAENIFKVALLGTKYTMEQNFYKDKLIEKNIQVLIPNDIDRELVHRVIYDELCLGSISEISRRKILKIIDKLAAAGAEGVILGCTEIGLLVKQKDTSIKLFDTTQIHARNAALYAIDMQK